MSGHNEGTWLRFRALRTWWQKLRGLLGTSPAARPVVLCGCSSIHTVGMRYPLDVALVSGKGTVLACERGVPAGRVVSAAGAWYAFERPSGEDGAPWPATGQKVHVEERAEAVLLKLGQEE